MNDELVEIPAGMAGRGGARANSGKPTNAEITGSGIVKRDFFTNERLQQLLDKMLIIALNEPVLQTMIDKDGKTHRLKVKPYSGKEQVSALSDLLNRGMGRAVQAVELQADVNSNGHPTIIFDFGDSGDDAATDTDNTEQSTSEE